MTVSTFSITPEIEVLSIKGATSGKVRTKGLRSFFNKFYPIKSIVLFGIIVSFWAVFYFLEIERNMLSDVSADKNYENWTNPESSRNFQINSWEKIGDIEVGVINEWMKREAAAKACKQYNARYEYNTGFFLSYFILISGLEKIESF